MSRAGRKLPVATLSLYRVESGQSRDGRATVRLFLVELRDKCIGKTSVLCTPHPLYLALGSEPIGMQSNYRELFKYHVEGKLLEDIRFAANKGMVLGNERFEAEVESLTGRRMTAKKMGRPVG